MVNNNKKKKIAFLRIKNLKKNCKKTVSRGGQYPSIIIMPAVSDGFRERVDDLPTLMRNRPKHRAADTHVKKSTEQAGVICFDIIFYEHWGWTK